YRKVRLDHLLSRELSRVSLFWSEMPSLPGRSVGSGDRTNSLEAREARGSAGGRARSVESQCRAGWFTLSSCQGSLTCTFTTAMQINISFTMTSILPRARREKQRNASGLACWLTEPLREYDESPQVNEET